MLFSVLLCLLYGVQSNHIVNFLELFVTNSVEMLQVVVSTSLRESTIRIPRKQYSLQYLEKDTVLFANKEVFQEEHF